MNGHIVGSSTAKKNVDEKQIIFLKDTATRALANEKRRQGLREGQRNKDQKKIQPKNTKPCI